MIAFYMIFRGSYLFAFEFVFAKLLLVSIIKGSVEAASL